MHRPGVELAIFRYLVRRPNHYTTESEQRIMGVVEVEYLTKLFENESSMHTCIQYDILFSKYAAAITTDLRI